MTDSFDYRKSKTVASSDRKNYPLSFDVWGRNKVYQDHSLLSSKFTFEIPRKSWVLPATTIGNGIVDSYNGALRIQSGTSNGNTGKLFGRRHPSYQPNRGHLYSTAGIIPNASLIGFTRRLGLYFTDEATYQSGVLFELRDGVWYGKTLTTHNGVLKQTEIVLNLDSGTNVEGGALFDIQFQWRGVGDYHFYIDQKLVGTIENLAMIDTDNKLSIINPSLPPRFESINTGGTGNAEMIIGCIDITSEGRGTANVQQGFIRSEFNTTIKRELFPLTATTSGTPVLILYIPHSFKGQHNTRDTKLVRLSLGLDGEGLAQGILTRDKSIFGLATLGDLDGETNFLFHETSSTTVPKDFSVKSYKGATLIDLTDKSKFSRINGEYINKTGGIANVSFSGIDSEVVITHGDYLIVYGGGIGAARDGFATITFEEEL